MRGRPCSLLHTPAEKENRKLLSTHASHTNIRDSNPSLPQDSPNTAPEIISVCQIMSLCWESLNVSRFHSEGTPVSLLCPTKLPTEPSLPFVFLMGEALVRDLLSFYFSSYRSPFFDVLINMPGDWFCLFVVSSYHNISYKRARIPFGSSF